MAEGEASSGDKNVCCSGRAQHSLSDYYFSVCGMFEHQQMRMINLSTREQHFPLAADTLWLESSSTVGLAGRPHDTPRLLTIKISASTPTFADKFTAKGDLARKSQ